jgi:hypothetical protein
MSEGMIIPTATNPLFLSESISHLELMDKKDMYNSPKPAQTYRKICTAIEDRSIKPTYKKKLKSFNSQQAKKKRRYMTYSIGKLESTSYPKVSYKKGKASQPEKGM